MLPKHISPPLAPEIYPESPGWRDASTSKEAAERVAQGAPSLRKRVLKLISESPEGVAVHEAARLLKVPVPSLQPRFSELRRLGEIRPSGQRRTNDSGMSAHVWIAKTEASKEDLTHE
jgi:hypothetical protein